MCRAMGRFDMFKLRSAGIDREAGLANTDDRLIFIPVAGLEGFTGAFAKNFKDRFWPEAR